MGFRSWNANRRAAMEDADRLKDTPWAFRIGANVTMVVAAVVVIVTLFIIAINYKQLPEMIPTRFDFDGNVTSYSKKGIVWFLWIMQMINVVIGYGVVLLVRYNPEMGNFPARVKNRMLAMARTQEYVAEMVALVAALMAMMVCCITGIIDVEFNMLMITFFVPTIIILTIRYLVFLYTKC